MTPKNATIIIVSSLAVVIALIFIPANDFFGVIPHDSESPSPMMVLENGEDIIMGFKIIPGSCNETPSGLTESQFQITNTNEKNFEVILGVSFTDNEEVLFEKQVKVEIPSGQTINQIHLSDDVYDNPVCVVKIIDWSEI
ncbi:MAG: hypothetical protein PVI88_02470 [Nitrosopumilaceae archaeon]|jgi:hypothetical protein